MKTYPKVLYIQDPLWLNDRAARLDAITDGATVGVYELRAVKVVKRSTKLVDPPQPDFPEHRLGRNYEK